MYFLNHMKQERKLRMNICHGKELKYGAFRNKNKCK